MSTLIHFLALQLHKSLPRAVFAQVEILLPHLHLTVSPDELQDNEWNSRNPAALDVVSKPSPSQQHFTLMMQLKEKNPQLAPLALWGLVAEREACGVQGREGSPPRAPLPEEQHIPQDGQLVVTMAYG